MRITIALALGAVFALLTATGIGQQPGLRQEVEVLQPGPMRIDPVKEGLFVVRGPFSPCMRSTCPPGRPGDGLMHESGDIAVRVTPDGLILVDDKFTDQLADVLATIRTVTSLPVRYMLNTHHHGDHVSGNVNFRQMGIDIIAHRNIRENFLRTKAPGEPNITFADQGSLHLGGVDVQMFHLGRGHTNGDTIVYFPDLKAIHMGDLVIDGAPVIDYAGGGSAIEFVKTIERILTIDFDVAIPGHGKLFTKDEVRAYLVRFQTMNQRMRELAKSGFPKDRLQTLDQVLAVLGLSDLGWENTVSTATFRGGVGRYYDEMAAAP
ncbi:MAG: MBL fold metallo-hydrolase [Acidobacteria bacterium]|nr:MBL fold metallo-hydrolase [Acidobacteriota bacterium]